jgi:hypothetical protein
VPANESKGWERETPQLMKKLNWYWIGTQYADGNWLRPSKENSYFFRGKDDNSFTVTTFCGKQTGTYELHQKSIAIVIDVIIDEKWVESKTEGRFFDDFNQVINLDQDGNRLSLRISNDDGVMHFQKK